MAKVAEDSDNVQNYIEERKKFEFDGWEIVYIFESRFLPTNSKSYQDVMAKLEEKTYQLSSQHPKKMGNFLKSFCPKKKFDADVQAVKIIHPATKEGFRSKGTIFLQDEFESDYKKENPSQFIEQFKKIVADKDLVPDESVIILSKDPHHLIMQQSKVQPRKKKLETAAKKKGQKLMTQFFQSVKKNPMAPTTPPEPKEEILVEKITRTLRGDLVKILWIPKDHPEVDPCQYASIFVLHEIANGVNAEGAEGTLKEIVEREIKLFPNEMWGRVIEFAEHFEDSYFEDDGEEERSD